MKKLAFTFTIIVCITLIFLRLSITTAANTKSSTPEDKNSNMKKTEEAVEASTNLSLYTFPSATPVRAKAGNDKFKVTVSVKNQEVTVYKNSTMIKKMSCSTGLLEEDYATPVGSYKVDGYSGYSFFNSKYQEGARYWVGFIDATYLFHSVPIDNNGAIIREEADKLGTPASHGCIRLSPIDAFWFYENIPKGADVLITN